MTRPVPKATFSHGLWLPRQQRNPWRDGECKQQPTADRLSSPQRKSSPTSFKFGLLNPRSVGNEYVNIASLITDQLYDVFLVTETWHTSMDDVALRRCVPDGFTCVEQSRPTTDTTSVNYGGVTAIVSDRLRCKRLTTVTTVTSFEYVCFTVTGRAATVVTLLVYRTGPVTDTFYKELSSLLEVLAVYKCQIIIAGDFNIHVEKRDDIEALRLQELLTSFDCVQNVPAVPTDRAGGTLDLVITKSDQLINNLTVQSPDILSDHSLLTCCLRLPLTERSGGGRSWMLTSFALHFWSRSYVILRYATVC